MSTTAGLRTTVAVESKSAGWAGYSAIAPVFDMSYTESREEKGRGKLAVIRPENPQTTRLSENVNFPIEQEFGNRTFI